MAQATPTDLGRIQPVDVQDDSVQAIGLTKQFGDEFAVRDVTFVVPRGSIFGFIGPSGSGKTTTVRLLTGIYQPTSGESYVLGRRPQDFSQRLRSQIGYMPQLFVLYPNLSVWENLNFTASLYGMSFRRKKRLMEVLDFVELTGHRKKLARNISGGMQRRLSLAATLVHSPELIFLDEPTAGVDPVLRRKFWDHFKELQTQNRTLFITTQYVNEAAYCDLVGIMVQGKLLMVDTPESLRHKAFGGEIVHLMTTNPLTQEQERQIIELPFTRGHLTYLKPTSAHIVVDEASTAIPMLLNWGRENNVPVDAIEEYLPPFDDVFVELVRNKPDQGEEQNG